MSKFPAVSKPAPGGSCRRARKKQRTRQEIQRAALALFAQRGFDPVTLEMICERADVARGTFFLHFPSKGALLQELERQLAGELEHRFAEPRGSALAEYRTLVGCLCEEWPGRDGLRPDLLAALLRERLAAPAAASAAVSGPEPEPGSDLRACSEAIVRRGQQRGELRRSVSPRLAATALLATAAAALEVAAAGRAPGGLRDELLQTLLHGVAEGKPRLKWSPAAGARV